MKKMKEIESKLKAKAFIKDDSYNEWCNDDFVVRFDDTRMEVYEKLDQKTSSGLPKYYLSEIDLEMLSLILDDL